MEATLLATHKSGHKEVFHKNRAPIPEKYQQKRHFPAKARFIDLNFAKVKKNKIK